MVRPRLATSIQPIQIPLDEAQNLNQEKAPQEHLEVKLKITKPRITTESTMKTIIYLIAVAALTGAAHADAEAPLPKMVEIGKTVATSKPSELARTSADFEKAVKDSSLAPSPSIRVEVIAVRDAASRLINLLGEGKFQKDSAEAKAVANAVKSTLDKLDSLIDENFKYYPALANISPPPGTPNAAAGMNPDAIRDPKLRQQYLDSFEDQRKKQEKNKQQRESVSAREQILKRVAALDSWRVAAGLSKEEFIETFTNKGKSRELLREMVAPVAPR